MRFAEFTSGLYYPITNEQDAILKKMENGFIARDNLNNREVEVARKMISSGILDRHKIDDGIYYAVRDNFNEQPNT